MGTLYTPQTLLRKHVHTHAYSKVYFFPML